MELSPKEIHYFKRELIATALTDELEAFQHSPLSSLMAPESPFPFLHFLFKRLVAPFPLLRKTDDTFWSQVEAFWKAYQGLIVKTYTPYDASLSLVYRLNHLLVIALTSMIKTTHGQEESFDLKKELMNDISLAEIESEEGYMAWINTDGPEVNVVSVRHNVHDEFIVKTESTYVVRRYGQFRQLREDLRIFEDQEIPFLPGKARDPSYGSQATCLFREKDRILLRLFLRQIAASELAQSDVFQRFLTDDPIELSEEEKKDVQEREAMDQKRAQEEKRFKVQVDQKIVELDGLLLMLRQKVMQPKGLLDVFDVIKRTEKINDLPDELKKAIEWGRINFAFVLHTQFVTSDKSVENVANLKRTNALMPYRAIAQILKLSNPLAMIKGVLDLFLAQPFGQKSLFQRIVMANMNEETKEMQRDIEELEKKINDPKLCLKLANAVKTKKEEDSIRLDDPILETLNVLKIPSIQPELSADQILKVAFANQPNQEASRELVFYLHKLWSLYAKRYEHDTLMRLLFQGETCDLIKNLFAVFYEPLAEVYRAANIGDSIMQVSEFMNDLIQLLDSLNIQDATNSSELFIELVRKHEGSFYAFVHNVHVKDQTKLFDALLDYVDSIFSLVTQGLPKKVDLNACVEQSLQPDQHQELKKEIEQLCEYHRERKEKELNLQRQELMAREDFSGIISDFEDIDCTRMPLVWIPKVAPSFVKQLIDSL